MRAGSLLSDGFAVASVLPGPLATMSVIPVQSKIVAAQSKPVSTSFCPQTQP